MAGVSSNGKRRPPRPRIELTASAPPEEAAAVVAALERFLAETAPAPSAPQGANPWQRAALIEGVGGHAEGAALDPWGEARGWGERHRRGF